MTEQERFQRCLAEVLRLEGGYVDDPRDPGGATKFGVTRGVLGEALGRPATVADVEALTEDLAARIYRDRYWRTTACGRLPAGVDLMVFDAAVNMGVATSGRLLQAALGVTVDGIVGANTVARVALDDAALLIGEMANGRRTRYRALAGFAAFGAGWLKRTDEVEALALSWVGED